jgi:hypothetical protein
MGLYEIDYVYISEGLLEHVVGIEMLNFDVVFDSNHRTFFHDLDCESFFGTEQDSGMAQYYSTKTLHEPLHLKEGAKHSNERKLRELDHVR